MAIMAMGSPPRLDRDGLSRLNVELHASVVAAVNTREVPREILAPEFCLENHASSVTDYTYRGAMGWRDWISDIFEEFTGEVRYEIEEIIGATEDLVAAAFRIVGPSVHSGRPLSLRWTSVTWFRDGKVTRTIGYSTRAEALAAIRRPGGVQVLIA